MLTFVCFADEGKDLGDRHWFDVCAYIQKMHVCVVQILVCFHSPRMCVSKSNKFCLKLSLELCGATHQCFPNCTSFQPASSKKCI